MEIIVYFWLDGKVFFRGRWCGTFLAKYRLINVHSLQPTQRVVSQVVMIAIGVKSDGSRDVLGVHMGLSESEVN